MERKYVCTRFKTLKDLSAVAVEGGIVSKIFCLNIYTSAIDTDQFKQTKTGG
jgi:hypothetical protein